MPRLKCNLHQAKQAKTRMQFNTQVGQVTVFDSILLWACETVKKVEKSLAEVEWDLPAVL